MVLTSLVSSPKLELGGSSYVLNISPFEELWENSENGSSLHLFSLKKQERYCM